MNDFPSHSVNTPFTYHGLPAMPAAVPAPGLALPGPTAPNSRSNNESNGNSNNDGTGTGESSQPTIGRTVSSKICSTCRDRKVRCDGRRDTCFNCERLQLPCSYDGTTSGIRLPVGGHDGSGSMVRPRRRVRHACSNCHSRKAKCSGTTPKCQRCLAQGLTCIYRPTKRNRIVLAGADDSAHPQMLLRGDVAHSPTSADDSATVLPVGLQVSLDSAAAASASMARRVAAVNQKPRHLRRHSSTSSDFGPLHIPSNYDDADSIPDELEKRALHAFFRYVHHLPSVSFLHRASFMKKYRNGGVEKPLLLGLVGLTSLMVDLGPGVREYGTKCIRHAESLILAELDKVTVVKLQTLCLILKHRLLSRNYTSAFVLVSIASRFVALLDLNHEQPELAFLDGESRRRLMWSLFMMDSDIACGNEENSLWSADRVKIQLPCNERNYEFGLPQAMEALVPPQQPIMPDLGSLGLYVRIHWIAAKVSTFVGNTLRSPPKEVLTTLPAAVAALERDLDEFNQRLPPSYKFSDENLQLRLYSPRLYAFVMVHIWWRQCYVDLYKICMCGHVDALPVTVLQQCEHDFLVSCRSKCVEHALVMTDMFATMAALELCIPITDLDFPVCAYECARLLFCAARFPAARDQLGLDPRDVRRRIEGCLLAIKTPRLIGNPPSPAVLCIRGRLQRLLDSLGGPVANDDQYASTGRSRSTPPCPTFNNCNEPVISRHALLREMDLKYSNDTVDHEDEHDEEDDAHAETDSSVRHSPEPPADLFKTPAEMVSVPSNVVTESMAGPQHDLLGLRGVMPDDQLVNDANEMANFGAFLDGLVPGWSLPTTSPRDAWP